MKYIIMDYTDGDCFTDEFDNKEEAVLKAEGKWSNLTRFENAAGKIRISRNELLDKLLKFEEK